MDTKDLADIATDEHALVQDNPDIPCDTEEAPAIAMHPLVVAIRQLEILQNQVFLAGPTSNIQAQSMDGSAPAGGEDTGPYCRLACDVLSCTVSACELWRESLLRHPAPMNPNGPMISTAELYRLLSKLLASMHILDCLKDSKHTLRAALSAVTAQEGDEQQLLTAVQDFFNMPTACLVLLRDMLLEQPEGITQTKAALSKLLEFQIAAVDGAGGQEGGRKRGSIKSKLGLSSSSLQAGGDDTNGLTDVNVAAKSGARIALSLLIHLYCSVDSVEQEHQAFHAQNADGTTGLTPKAHGVTVQKLRACVATLRNTPIVPGYCDISVDLLKPLQGLPQLGPPWEPPAGVEMAALEERYCLAAVAAAAAADYGRLVEELLSRKLQFESDKQRMAEDGRDSSAGGSSGVDLRTSAPDVPLACRSNSQAHLSKALGVLAARGMQLLQDWQAAILQLDAFRTWQRRQRQAEEAARGAAAAAAAVDEGAGAEQPQAKASIPRCVFTPADMPDVVRMVSYIKGLHSILADNMLWIEPLLRVHCAAHLAQLLNTVVVPVASGVLGMPPPPAAVPSSLPPSSAPQTRAQLPSMIQASCDGQPMSVLSSARDAILMPVNTAAGEVPDPSIAEAAAAGLAMGIGRMWKTKALRHGRTRSTASSLEVMAPDARPSAGAPSMSGATTAPPPAGGQADGATVGPSQRTTEDSADTGNLIASITADGNDWALGRPGELRNDPYLRLREWFAAGGANPTGAAPVQCLNTPLQSVPEAASEKQSPVPSVAPGPQGRRAVMTPTAEAGSVAGGNTQRGGSCEQNWAGGSGARLATTTGTEGTEDGVECTVSSVSDCEGLMAALDSEEACDSGTAVGDDGSHPQVAPAEPPKEEAAPDAQSPKMQAQSPAQQPWPAADMLWPPPPVPSASWLAGNVASPANAPNTNAPNNTTVSAGGASGGSMSVRSPAGAPRLTAPAALSTNPLYIYPSAAREAVAEQERATVAIWIASEGGAPMSPALAGLEQHGLAAAQATADRGNGEGLNTPSKVDAAAQQQQQLLLQGQGDFSGNVRMLCDDLGATPQIDSVARQHSCYEGSNARLEMHLQHDDASAGYCDDLRLSHAQMMDAPFLPQPDFGNGLRASCDGMPGHVHYDNDGGVDAQPHTQGVKKIASSPFKRIKKLFSKRGDKTSAPPLPLPPTQYDDNVLGAGYASDPAMEAYYGTDYPAGMAGFSALPAPYLVDPREIASLDLESSALFGVQGANYGAYGSGTAGQQPPQTLSGEFLPGIMAEAASRDGAVAVLSVGPVGQVLGGGTTSTEQQQASGEADTNAAGGRGKTRPSAGGGAGAGGVGLGSFKGASAFLETAARAREEHSCQRLLVFANDMQVCLVNAGLATGTERTSAPVGLTPGQRVFRASRKGAAASGARASLKKLVTSIKSRGGSRNRSGGGAGTVPDQDVHAWTCDAVQGSGLDAQGFTRLRNLAELMAEELARWLNQRRDRGKSTKDGPSTMQLLALSSELRHFLAVGLPSLEPLLSFRTSLAAAADLSALLLLDPSRSYGSAPGNGLSSDARGSVPWELANKGVLVGPGVEGAAGRAVELPLSAGLTVLTLFKDAVDTLQMQQAQAAATGYPEPPTAARLQLLYRRQAKWCLGTFVQMAARKVWGTYKAQALRCKLGLVVPPGAHDVASSTVAFQGLFRPLREDTVTHQLLLLTNTRPDLVTEGEVAIIDQLSGAIDDLVRQSASRTADLLLGSDLTSLVAVKQQLDVFSAAVSRLCQELPGIRPWKDVWLAALAARAASSPTCASIAEAAAATAAAVTQGCGGSAAGITISAEDIILTHACSIASLRTLSTWSYDMTAVKFRPTKHTKSIWEGLVGSTSPDTVSPLVFPDGADIALASITIDATSGIARPAGRGGGDANTTYFSRAHVQALHGLLGLTGLGRWVAALRRHAAELLSDAAPLLRRVHELYDTSLAGPRGPSMRESGGASGYLQLQQRWLRDRGHSELLVSAHRAMQALGNSVAAVALTDSVLAELCVNRAPHLLPLAASGHQADHQAHAALKILANAESNAVGAGTGLVKPAAALTVPPPPRGAGLAGLLLGQPLPPGLMAGTQSAVQAASLVQDRLQEQLPAAFGLPGLWRALHECLNPSQLVRSDTLLSAARLWSVVQVQLSCLTPEEQVVHTANVGDGVYVSAAALVQLAAGAAIAPGSVLHGDTMTQLQQAVALEQLKAELVTVPSACLHAGHPAGPLDKLTLEQLKAWSARAEIVRSAWDRAVQLTVGAGTAASKLSGQRTSRSESSTSQHTRAIDTPALVSCSLEPWMALAQQASIAGTALLVRAAAAAAAPPPQSAAQQQAATHSQGPPASRGQAPSLGRPPSQPGVALTQTVPRSAPPRPPTNTGSQQPGSVGAGGTLHRTSLNGPPLPPRGMSAPPGPAVHFGRNTTGHIESPLTHSQPPPSQPQQQQPLQQLRAASQVLMKSPRGEGSALGTHGLFTMAGSTAAQSRSRAASSLGDWNHME